MLPDHATDLPATPEYSGFPDEITLCDLITDAKPGTVIVYHVGHLAFDRTLTAGVLPEWRRRELGAVANRAFRLAESGWVHLLQRRVDAMRCAYLIVVRPRPRRCLAAIAGGSPPFKPRSAHFATAGVSGEDTLALAEAA